MILTSAKEDGEITEYEEDIGHAITYFEDEVKELAEKTIARKKEIEKMLENAGIKSKTGKWENCN